MTRSSKNKTTHTFHIDKGIWCREIYYPVGWEKFLTVTWRWKADFGRSSRYVYFSIWTDPISIHFSIVWKK